MDTIEKKCKNCGAQLHGEYCSECGQRDIELHLSLKELLKEFAEEFFSFDSRLVRSFVPFLLKPGLLTTEYVA